MAAKTRTKKKKSKRSPQPRRCSVCHEVGHYKTYCPDNVVAAAELQRRLMVVDTNKPAPKEGEPEVVLQKCAFTWCKHVVEEATAYMGTYCSYTCFVFNSRRQNGLSGGISTYKPEFANEKLFQFVQMCEQSHESRFAKVGDTLVPIRRLILPTISEYATFLGYPEITLRLWVQKHQDFRLGLLFLKQIQKNYLINKGMTGEYNAILTKLILGNHHGMVEKKETTVNTNMIGIVKEVYEKADQYERQSIMESEPFDEEDEDDGDNYNLA